MKAIQKAKYRTRPLPAINEVEPLITLSCQAWPLSEACRWIADEAGVSIVMGEKLDDKLVTLDVTDQPVSLLLQTVAKRVGVAANRTGSVYFIGNLSREDRGVLVRRAPKLTASELATTIDSFTSEKGTVVAYENGVVVVGDRVDVLERVNQLLDELEAIKSRTWVVQLHIVSMSQRAVKDFGLDLIPAGEVAAQFNGSPAGSASSAELEASLRAILRASGESSDVEIVAEPVLVIEDGKQGTLRIVERRPYRNTISTFEDGVRRDSEQVDFIDVGLSIEVTAREGAAGHALIETSVTLSEEVASVATVPVVSEQVLESRASVQNDVVSLLGSLARSRQEGIVSALFTWGDNRAQDQELLQVWCRVYSVE